jgi:hypothetical protein
MIAVDGQWVPSDGPDVLNDAIESIPPIKFNLSELLPGIHLVVTLFLISTGRVRVPTTAVLRVT